MHNYKEFLMKNLVVIIIFCLFPGCSEKTDIQYNEQAVNYINRGHYDDAISALRKSIKHNPSSAEAHFNLGRAYRKKGMEKKAMKEFTLSYKISTKKFSECVIKYNEKVDLEINDAQYLIELGSAYAEKGMLDDAITTYEKAIEIGPENAHIHYSLGNVYSKNGMYIEAVDEFRRTIEINHDMPEAHYNLGLIYYKQEKFKMAINAYRKALELLPDARGRKRASVHYKLGLAYNDQGMLDDAVIELHKALEITPDDSKVHYKLSSVYKENGMFDKAEKELEIYKKLKDKKKFATVGH